MCAGRNGARRLGFGVASALAGRGYPGGSRASRLRCQHLCPCIRGLQMGDTPLHVSARLGKTKCVELLLKQGADTQCKNKVGSERNALDSASSRIFYHSNSAAGSEAPLLEKIPVLFRLSRA